MSKVVKNGEEKDLTAGDKKMVRPNAEVSSSYGWRHFGVAFDAKILLQSDRYLPMMTEIVKDIVA